MAEHYDTIILGGGNAGFGVSSVLSEAGKSMAFVEQAQFGGTCPNRGCTPKKVLVEAAYCLDMIERAAIHGIKVGKPKVNWNALITRKNDLIGFIPEAMESLAKKRGTVYSGEAKFSGPNQIMVDDHILEADNIVIATGSKTRTLPIAGAEHMLTSDDVLESHTLPESVVFIGGGVIAMEFSHVYARAGVKVTILEVMPQLLPRLDIDAVAALQEQTEALGIDIYTGVSVKQIVKVDDKIQVEYEKGGTKFICEAQHVINGAGRVPNVETLNLEAAGITHERGYIATDDFLRAIDNPHIWVTGDALARAPQLSPVATLEGQLVGHNIIGEQMRKMNYNIVPTSVFTMPTLSSAGLTEREAKQQELDVRVSSVDMTQWFSSRSHAESKAWVKTIIDNKTDTFVGVHIVGHKGEELINLFALAMRHKITASQLKADLFAYPTFGADIKNWW